MEMSSLGCVDSQINYIKCIFIIWIFLYIYFEEIFMVALILMVQ